MAFLLWSFHLTFLPWPCSHGPAPSLCSCGLASVFLLSLSCPWPCSLLCSCVWAPVACVWQQWYLSPAPPSAGCYMRTTCAVKMPCQALLASVTVLSWVCMPGKRPACPQVLPWEWGALCGGSLAWGLCSGRVGALWLMAFPQRLSVMYSLWERQMP